MYLKVYANHLKGVKVMATINLQCNIPSQIHSSVYFRLIIVSQVEHIHGRSADTSLAEIHEEMSELLDKQVNYKESSKILLGFTKTPASPQKSV